MERLILAVCTSRTPADAGSVADKTVRADFLERLVTGQVKELAGEIRTIHLIGASIVGELVLTGLDIGYPLTFDECEFDQAPRLCDANLLSLSLTDSTIPGLDATGLRVRGSVSMVRVTSTDTIDLRYAQIDGVLHFRECDLRSSSHAVRASQMAVGSNVSFAKTAVTGQIRMIGAQIGGAAIFRGAELHNPGNVCLQAERTEIDEGLWFDADATRRAATVEGRIILDNAKVGGSILLSGVALTHPHRGSTRKRLKDRPTSLQAYGLKVTRDIRCDQAFRSDGAIGLCYASVEGAVSFDTAAFAPGAADSAADPSLVDLSGTSAGMVDLDFAQPPATLDMTNVSARVVTDNPSTWPAAIVLDGFAYDRLSSPQPVTVHERIRWLTRGDATYRPQPYEQLIAAYRQAGQEHEARVVGYRKQHARAKEVRGISRIWSGILWATVGYGYRTWLASIWLIGLTALGWSIFTPIGDSAIAAVEKPPQFHSLVYSVDLLIPVVSLGQDSTWRFDSGARWVAWGLVLSGWVLTTAVATAIARVLRQG
ncbi:hypothetical protein OHB44_14380 [Micromonospora sp. NBC_00821]|uniref:hypothetical protein n=1 Tax=Micromonospora sp. NBC_00821 TaxID=2975977 RepID=UPI002ED32BA1|nr:hypothetical protein OHB44_14380 [Micromonospora sp. NBC_00821]